MEFRSGRSDEILVAPVDALVMAVVAQRDAKHDAPPLREPTPLGRTVRNRGDVGRRVGPWDQHAGGIEFDIQVIEHRNDHHHRRGGDGAELARNGWVLAGDCRGARRADGQDGAVGGELRSLAGVDVLEANHDAVVG